MYVCKSCRTTVRTQKRLYKYGTVCVTCNEPGPTYDDKCGKCLKRCGLKYCRSCRRVQSRTEFYPHRAICLSCEKSLDRRTETYMAILEKKRKRKEEVRLKQCVTCRKTKPKDEFYRRDECTTCSDAVSDEQHRDRYRGWMLRKLYNLSLDDYERMKQEQGGVCKICKGSSSTKALVVDHCHLSGKVRGLLCHNCNTGLGMFRDNPMTMRSAADYLG